MIKLQDFKNYFDAYLTRIPAIKRCILVANEPQLLDYIKNMPESDFPALVVLIPSSDSIAANPDNIMEANSCLIYILSKINKLDETPASWFTNMGTTQQIMSDVKNMMLADRGNHDVMGHLLQRLDLNRMHTDPEYNYLGCNGWSLSFLILTPGF